MNPPEDTRSFPTFTAFSPMGDAATSHLEEARRNAPAMRLVRDEPEPAEVTPAPLGRLCDTSLFPHYVESLLAGDRPACRRLVEQAAACGVGAERLVLELCWPAMEAVRQLYKDSRISLAAHHMATRLNRATVDRITGELPALPANGRRVLVSCGDAQGEELGGQIVADLFEANGYEVKFLGGGVPLDEVNHLVGLWRPNLLVLFATLAAELPATRKLIDHLRDHGTIPDLQVMCCGGIYRRAPGLGEEVGADLVARDAADAVAMADDNLGKKATARQQTVGRTRRDRVTKEKRDQKAQAAARKAGQAREAA